METFRPIEGTGLRYFVSDEGTVIRQYKTRKTTTVKQRIDRAGYSTVRLFLAGKSHTRFVHRLVAEAFHINDLQKPQVNHINGIKTDNRAENLEWVTHSENARHAFITGLHKKKGKVIINELTGQVFVSISEAAISLGLKPGTVRNYLNGNIKRNKTFLRYGEAVQVHVPVSFPNIPELDNPSPLLYTRKITRYV